MIKMQSGWALVIDADTSTHDLYRQTLSEVGFDVDICDRGASAALALMRRVYDLILLNPSTPGMYGLEIVSQPFRQPAPVIVIGPAAAREGELQSEGLPGLLYKPFNAGQLRQSVERTLRERRDDQAVARSAPGVKPAGGESDVALLYEYLVRILMVKFDADRTSLILWRDESDQIHVAASAGLPFMNSGNLFAPLNESVAAWVIRHAEPLLLEPDGELPFDLLNAWQNEAIRSGMCVPLVVRGQVLGVLALARHAGRTAFTGADLDLLVYMASQVATMLEQARLNTQSQQRLQLMARLNSLGTALMSTGELQQALELITDQLVDTFPLIQGYLFLREAQSPWIDRVFVIGEQRLAAPSLDTLRDQPGLAGQVLADGVSRLRRSADAPHELANWEQRLARAGQPILCVALKTTTAVYGAIELAGWSSGFDDEDTQFISALGALGALAIERVQGLTELARAASRYSALFQHAADAIFLIDSVQQTIVAANPAAERMSGYSQPELALIAPDRLIAPAAQERRPVVPVAELLTGALTEFEGAIRTSSGYSVPVSIAANQVTFEATAYLLLVVRNMSDAQRRTLKIVQSEKLAGMARLTTAIAHEVNNPLQALHNTLHLLLSRSFTEDKRERLLSMAQMEVDRLTIIVRRMLELHRPTNDDMRLVSIHSLLEGALASAGPQLQQHQVLIERDWAEQLPWVNGIGGHLKQVFHDLAMNAAEAMPNGGRLMVSTRVEEGALNHTAPRVLVEFVDTGPGIPESETQLIFEPFYTAKRTNTGLGLAISYSIIERHGGMLTVRSGSGGTTFQVLLPAVASASA